MRRRRLARAPATHFVVAAAEPAGVGRRRGRVVVGTDAPQREPCSRAERRLPLEEAFVWPQAALSAATLSRTLGAFMLAVAPIVPCRNQILDAIGAADRTKTGDDPVREVVPLLGVGAAAGFLAGLFGVGGGAVVVPLLALATDLDHKTALGTSLCAMVPTGVAGVLAHRRLGHVKLAAAAPLGLGTCVGAFAGGRLASGLDEEPMRLGFGALMVALGAKTLLKKP